MERSIYQVTRPEAVLAAMRLADNLGDEDFAARHGFRRARAYRLVHGGRDYDSKAIAGVAFGLQYPEHGPLPSEEFVGGRQGAALVLTRLGFEIRRDGTPEDDAPRAAPHQGSHLGAASQVAAESVGQQRHSRVLLLGCVKGKGSAAAPARELYISDLFRKRRAYAEAAGAPWFILSAEHGLVDPDEVLEPYDRALKSQSADYRRCWGQEVVETLQRRLGQVSGTTFEVHAGAPYVEAIRELLETAGARIALPVRGLTQGQQLAWYLSGAATGVSRRPVPPRATEVEAAAAALTHPGALRSPRGFPWGRADLHQPGLYAWAVDDDGARDLTRGSGRPVGGGLVYVGQAGATSWPSGKRPESTLASRVRGNHLRGRVTASTWRLSLAALLQEPLGLHTTRGELDDRSKTALTEWMEDRLRLAVHPAPDRDALGALEHAVLARLDPPLNLDGMSSTPLRAAVTARRAALLDGEG